MVEVIKVEAHPDQQATLHRLSNGWTVYETENDYEVRQLGHKFTIWITGSRPTKLGGALTLAEAVVLASARQELADANFSRMAFGEEYK